MPRRVVFCLFVHQHLCQSGGRIISCVFCARFEPCAYDVSACLANCFSHLRIGGFFSCFFLLRVIVYAMLSLCVQTFRLGAGMFERLSFFFFFLSLVCSRRSLAFAYKVHGMYVFLRTAVAVVPHSIIVPTSRRCCRASLSPSNAHALPMSREGLDWLFPPLPPLPRPPSPPRIVFGHSLISNTYLLPSPPPFPPSLHASA